MKRSHSQPQSGCLEERRQQRALAPLLRQRCAHGRFEDVEIGRGEARQITVLGMPPDVLDRVEVRGVGREPGLDTLGLVGAAPVPDEDEAPGAVAAEIPQEAEDLTRPDVVAVQSPVEPEPLAVGRQREGASPGESIAAVPLAEDGRLPPWCPRAAADRLEHEPALVKEDDATAGPPGVFWSSRSDMARPSCQSR